MLEEPWRLVREEKEGDRVPREESVERRSPAMKTTGG
jgi:hypothetical protein